LRVRFGGVLAIDGVSFDLAAGEIVGLVGPNGAGKTTLLNCISRLQVPEAGDLSFCGQSLLAVPAHALAGLGIARTFQNLALFGSMSVRDNVLAGTQPRHRAGLVAHALALATVRREARDAEAEADRLLEACALSPLAMQPVSELSLGMRRRVELARALASAPRLLLLDEPASGLTVDEADQLAASLLALRERTGLAVLMIEHRMRLVSALCDRVIALDFGSIIADGPPGHVRAHPEVIAAWLGTHR
jgi:branched-chain amino acid transport system ATP-binding protein